MTEISRGPHVCSAETHLDIYYKSAHVYIVDKDKLASLTCYILLNTSISFSYDIFETHH